jgi:hypothetical protein
MQASLKDIFNSVLSLWPKRKGTQTKPAATAAMPPPAIPLHLVAASMGANAASVNDESIQQEATAWLLANGHGKVQASSDFWRALALATPVIQQLAVSAAAHQRLAEPATLPMLQLIALMPAEWKGPWRDLAARWLQHQLVAAGWPQDRISRNTRRNQHPTTVLNTLRHSTEPCLAVLLACGPESGEGAAGLLLADDAQGALLGSANFPLLQSVAEGRASHVPHAPAPGCAILREIAQQAGTKPLPVAVPLAAVEHIHRSPSVLDQFRIVKEDALSSKG